MNKALIHRFAAISVIFLSACSPLYVPNTRNVPLFREQGDFQVSGYLTTAGVDGQMAVAVSNHIAATGSYSYGSQKRPTQNYTRKNNYGELGIGYFDVNRKSRFEVLAGYGAGQGTSFSQYYFFLNSGLGDIVATGKMNRIYIQPSIGTNGPKFNIALTARISHVNYTSFTSQGVTIKPAEKPQWFLEPAVTTKFPLAGNLHGVAQLGLAVPFGAPFFDYMPLQFSFGVQLDTSDSRSRRR